MGFDDRKTSWEISIFFIILIFLIVVADKLRRIEFEMTTGNPVFYFALIALFLSITYWIIRYFKTSRKTSLTVMVILIILVLVMSAIGIKFFVITSNSMRHRMGGIATYEFWEKMGYSKAEFDKLPVSGGFQAGDIIVARKTDNLRIGDIAVYTWRKTPIAHRIYSVNDTKVITTGDASPPSNISKAMEIIDRKNIYGTVMFAVPKGGIMKMLYNCYLGEGCSYKDCFVKGNCGSYRSK